MPPARICPPVAASTETASCKVLGLTYKDGAPDYPPHTAPQVLYERPSFVQEIIGAEGRDTRESREGELARLGRKQPPHGLGPEVKNALHIALHQHAMCNPPNRRKRKGIGNPVSHKGAVFLRNK